MTQQQDTKDTPVAQTVDPAPVITTVKDKKDPRRVAQGVWLAGISAKAKREKKEADKRKMDEMAEDAKNWGEHKRATSKDNEEKVSAGGWGLPKLEGPFAYLVIALAVLVTYFIVGRNSSNNEHQHEHQHEHQTESKEKHPEKQRESYSYFGNQ